MKITFLVLFAALLVLSLLTWRVQPNPEPAGKIQLVRVSDINPLRQAQVDLFNKLHPKLDMVLDPNTADTDKVIVESLGGVGPDLFDCFDPFQLSAYVDAGIAWDITDELKKRGLDIQKECFSGIVPTGMRDGRVYGVPTNIAVDAIWYQKDMFEKAGIKPHLGPWKWQDFIPVAQRLTTRDADGRPICYGFLFEWWQWPSFFVGFGAPVYSPDGKKCIVDSPRAIAAVQLMHDLVYKYKVSSSPVEEASMATAGGFGSGSISVFGDRHAAMALGGRWWLGQLSQYHGLRLGVMEEPNAGVRKFDAYGRATLINKNSPHREQALEYLMYQSGPEYNALVNAQGDGISAFKKYAHPGATSPDPNPTDFETWREITSRAVSPDTSKFVNGKVVQRIMTEQLDLVKADQKSPAEAMRTAAEEVNEEIRKNLDQDHSE